MAKIYYKKIKEGKITIEDVPAKWRDEVQRMLDEDDSRGV